MMRPTEPGGVPYPVQNGIGDGQAAPFRNSGAGLPFGYKPLHAALAKTTDDREP